MVKYRSKGNLPQNADYYALLNRSDADWRDTVRQGLCATFNGTSSECSLGSAIDLSGNWSMEISFAPAVLDVLQYLVSEVLTSPTRRFYVSLENGKIILYIGTGTRVVISDALTIGVSYTLYMSYSSTTGTITSKLRTLSTGALTDLTDYTVVGLDATTGTWMIGRAPSSGWYRGCIHELTIWKSTKTVAQMDSTKTDAELCIPFSGSVLDISGNYTVSSANITYGRNDYASFRNDEHPFVIGTTLIGNASGLLNYGVRNLITTSTTKMRWQFKLNTVTEAEIARHICSEYNTAGSKRSWDWSISSTNRLYFLIGASGGGSASVNATPEDGGGNGYFAQSGDLVDIKWESGIITVLVNNTTTYTYDASATQTVIYNNNSPDLNVGGYQSATTSSFRGSLCCFKIWVDNILDTDTPKFECDYRGTATDKISGTVPAVVGTMVYLPQIHPRLLDDSGYAGTITGPYEEFSVKPHPNTFTGNWHELTHAYFDKSNTDIWEDFVRESINYISEEPNYWHVDELTQDFIDTYVKAAYADKIFVGLDATDSDYAGAVMVFESGITADQLKDLNFWRKRKYFPERV